MPPKANKIATAMAAVNRAVVRNVAAANRAVVKNYNAANRAINRAPAWVKWTIAAIAVAIILYALWKVFFAGKKEGFASAVGYAGYPNTDMRYHGDIPGAASRKTLADAASDCANRSDCNGFAFDMRGSSDSTGMYYPKIITTGGTCNDDQGITLYVKTNFVQTFKGINGCNRSEGGVATVVGEANTGATMETAAETEQVIGMYNGFNVWRLERNQDLGNITLADCMRQVRVTPITGTDKKYRSGTWHKDASGTTGSCWAKDFSSVGSQTAILMDDALSMFTYNDDSFPYWEEFKSAAGTVDKTTRKTYLEEWLEKVKREGAVAAIPEFDLTAANKKVSETKGYEDFTGTGFDGVDFLVGPSTDHGSMSVDACVDKVRSGVISDMIYNKITKKCYGTPINYDNIKEGYTTVYYNPNLYSASWHPSLKNMKVSQDKFLLVNKGDTSTYKRYWMDRDGEFKAVQGWKYKDVTAWMYENAGDGKWRIINSNGSARLAVDSGASYLKMVGAGDNSDYTNFIMEKIPGTVEEYYIKTRSGGYITTWKKPGDNSTLYASLASTPVDLNNPSIRWVKIAYFTA